MPDEKGMVRSVAWGEVFPWLMIARSLRLATSVPILFVATIGTLLVPAGWWGASLVLDESRRPAALKAVSDPWQTPVESGHVLRMEPPSLEFSWERGDFWQPMLAAARSPVDPLFNLAFGDEDWHERGYWALGGLWNLVVWGFFGAVISRIAVVRYGRQEREGLFDAVRFVRGRYAAYLGTPLFALSGVIIVMLISIPLGWLAQSDVGVAVVGVLWCFVLLGGLLIALFLLGLLFGWPLIWGALSTEEMGDVFEGAQRMFAYSLGRPAHYLFYALLTLILGSLTYHVVVLFTQLVVYSGYSAVFWIVGDAFFFPDGGPSGNPSAYVAISLISWFNSLAFAIAGAFRYGFLFCAAGVVYLLIRRDADQIEYDNVWAPDQQTRYGLPPLTTDEQGVPGVDEADSESAEE